MHLEPRGLLIMHYKLKMADQLMQCNHFNVKHDGNIDFSFNKKNWSAGAGQSLGIFTSG